MDQLETLYDEFDANLKLVNGIESRGELVISAEGFNPHEAKDLEFQYSQYMASLGLEATEIDWEKIKHYKDNIVNASKATYKATSKVVESARILFDKTGSVALNRAKRNLAMAEGDLYSDTVVEVGSLSKKLSIHGSVPKDLTKAANSAIATAKHLRTVALPAIITGLQQVATVAYSANPDSTDDYTGYMERAVAAVSKAKHLLDFYSMNEITARYPGEFSIGSENNKSLSVDTQADISDAASQGLFKRVKKLNDAHLSLGSHPVVGKVDSRDKRVQLAGRSEAGSILAVVEMLINEGKALVSIKRQASGYTGVSVAKLMEANLKKMASITHKEFDSEGKASVMKQSDQLIDTPDRVRTSWCMTYLRNPAFDYTAIALNMAAIMYKMANAYIQLVETSIEHYQH